MAELYEARVALVRWLLAAFDPTQLHHLVADWASAKTLVHEMLAPTHTTAEEFTRALITKLEQHNLLNIEWFARLGEARPHRTLDLLPIVASFNAADPGLAQIEVLQRAVHRMRRTGATDDIRSCLDAATMRLPHLASKLTQMSRPPVRGSADAYLSDILDAAAHQDVDAAFRLLITYLGEHHGRSIARKEAESLSPIKGDTLPGKIVEKTSRYHARDEGHGPAASPNAPSPRRRAPPGHDDVFVCDGFRKTYSLGGRDTYQLRCSGLSLKLGQVVGVVSHNGGGKSTLLQILAGRLAPDRDARLRYPCFDPEEARRGYIEWQNVHRDIHYVPQHLDPWRETIEHELRIHTVRCGFRGAANDDEVQYACARLGLTGFLQHRWTQVSGGYQLKLELAKAIISPARLIILDEPLAPLDISAQQLILEELRNIACEQHNPRAVVLSTQHVWEAEQSVDRLLYIHEGDVTESTQLRGTCLEVYGSFTDAFVADMAPLGTIFWTHFKRTSFLLETNNADPAALIHLILERARTSGSSLKSIRDITISRIRDLRRRAP